MYKVVINLDQKETLLIIGSSIAFNSIEDVKDNVLSFAGYDMELYLNPSSIFSIKEDTEEIRALINKIIKASER